MSNSFKTFLKHTAKDFHNHSVNPPVVRASTIIFKSMNDIRKTQNKYKKDLENYLNQIWESESISIPYKVEDKTFFYFNDGSFQQLSLIHI